MKTLTISLLLGLFTLTAFATGQSGDILIWNNKKYSLFSNPLESYPNFNIIRGKLFGDKPIQRGTNCVRGYIAEWQMIDDCLYLTNIFSCYNNKLRADLNLLFPDMIKNGKIRADWVNDTFLVPDGKCIYYGNLGYVSIYETEYELTIHNGILIEKKTFDNSRSHISVFTQNTDSLKRFIDQNINWKIIPDTIKKSITVLLILSSVRLK